MTPQEAFDMLSYYTLSHKQEEFIHQYSVDAFAAQVADGNTKPITINFALFGLSLHIEKQFTGRQVQVAHMHLAKYKNKLPKIILPENRGEITAVDVLQVQEGDKRDRKIEDWMRCVWSAYKDSHEVIREFLEKYL